MRGPIHREPLNIPMMDVHRNVRHVCLCLGLGLGLSLGLCLRLRLCLLWTTWWLNSLCLTTFTLNTPYGTRPNNTDLRDRHAIVLCRVIYCHAATHVQSQTYTCIHTFVHACTHACRECLHLYIRGNHLSSTTCLTHEFFKNVNRVASYGDHWHDEQHVT